MLYFKMSEFACSCCGQSHMDPDFLVRLDHARGIAKIRFDVNSGYRCLKHNAEVRSTSDNHPSGHAADIACDNSIERMMILNGLITAGFKRIGIHNSKNFIHVDDMAKTESCWIYD